MAGQGMRVWHCCGELLSLFECEAGFYWGCRECLWAGMIAVETGKNKPLSS